jgi:cyanosortase A-associated protein
MGLIRKFKRATHRWVLDLIHEPGWSPGVDRLLAGMHAFILRLARISLPGIGSGRAVRNTKSIWLPIRQGILVFGAVASLGFLTAAVSRPVWISTASQPGPFPSEVVLAGHRSLEPGQGDTSIARFPRAEAATRYDIDMDGRVVTVEVRYFRHAAGNVAGYTQARLEHSPTFQIRNRTGIGQYAWFVQNDELFLTACIDIRGVATFQPAAFDKNRRLHDRDLMRTARWIFGLGPLEDRRAVWTLISLQLSEMGSADALSLLEPLLVDTAVQWRDQWTARAQE